MKLFIYKQSKDLLKRMIPLLFLLLPCLAVAGKAESRATVSSGDSLYIFRFVAGNDMFYIPWQGNDEQLRALCRMVDTHRAAIDAGTLPVQVDSYCASLPTEKENLGTAFVRANRVKSELITRKGLKEMNFVTANYARAYLNNKDVVVVTLRIPATKQPEQLEAVKEQPKKEEPKVEVKPQPKPAVEKQPQSEPQPDQVVKTVSERRTPYKFAVRTNLLYDAFLLPTLGIEWRINRNVGVKLDGSLSWWGNEHGKVQKMWLLNPEVRWYLLRDKRFYVGASGSYGQYNIYKYMLGNMLKDDTGYQGKLWNAGVTVGYQLLLCRSFSVDFNLGLGYTRSEYDSFAMIDKVRVYKDRDKSKNFWGPTQAGISLVWTIGGNE